jgi:hypothetical protein
MEQNSLLDSSFIVLSVLQRLSTLARKDFSKIAPALEEQAQSESGTSGGLEGQPAAHLDEALGSCRRGDLAVVAGRKACGGVTEANPV